MEKLIVHVEFDGVDSVVVDEQVYMALSRIRETIEGVDIGWRYFKSLEEAKDWEDNGFPEKTDDDEDSCPHCEGETQTGIVAEDGSVAIVEDV